MTPPLDCPTRYARSLAHLDRFRARGTWDRDAALRLLSGDIRAAARRMGQPVTGATAQMVAARIVGAYFSD